MNHEELYSLLINFQEESLEQLGMQKEGEYWVHPDSIHYFEVHENRLIVNLNRIMILRLNASFENPEGLYLTYIETEIIAPATYINYLRERGLNI